MLTLINKNYRSTPCSQNIVQILSLFLKNSSIFPSNNFWIFRPKYSNIRIIFGFWKCPLIEYEYQYSEENIRIVEYIRIFVSTLLSNPILLNTVLLLFSAGFQTKVMDMIVGLCQYLQSVSGGSAAQKVSTIDTCSMSVSVSPLASCWN